MLNPHPVCKLCVVGSIGLCAVMSDEQRSRIGAIAHRKLFHADDVVLGEDEASDFCAIVVSGVAKRVRSLSNGRQQIVGLLFPSDILGRPFGRNLNAIVAATDLQLCVFAKGAFEQLIKENPLLEHAFAEHVLRELDAAQDWMLVLGRKTAAEKIASFLLMAARRSPSLSNAGSPVPRFELPLSRSAIADYLGVRIETVSRQMTQLRRYGVIETDQGGRIVTVLDLQALNAAAEVGRD